MNDDILQLKHEVMSKLDKLENTLERIRTDNSAQNVQIAKLEMNIEKIDNAILEIDRKLMGIEARIDVSEKTSSQIEKDTVASIIELDRKIERQRSFINGLLWISGAFATVVTFIFSAIKFNILTK